MYPAMRTVANPSEPSNSHNAFAMGQHVAPDPFDNQLSKKSVASVPGNACLPFPARAIILRTLSKGRCLHQAPYNCLNDSRSALDGFSSPNLSKTRFLRLADKLFIMVKMGFIHKIKIDTKTML